MEQGHEGSNLLGLLAWSSDWKDAWLGLGFPADRTLSWGSEPAHTATSPWSKMPCGDSASVGHMAPRQT